MLANFIYLFLLSDILISCSSALQDVSMGFTGYGLIQYSQLNDHYSGIISSCLVLSHVLSGNTINHHSQSFMATKPFKNQY